ncbi:penicillin-binding protein [Clostridium sp. MSJ-8]|uniref:penicillin-binding transpeptidase domain-containing protein n=1 Tax=Clostridium sp. MSJ-8 TaxID=2841510 RepID=UPI001C0EFB47|nr:penicillin-binding transpeptidase domain-containing protein [Clostridium sp. MSJ-8]MBU5488933.1 penicillin-binding protein [Clostridium sp. MSJ-8]
MIVNKPKKKKKISRYSILLGIMVAVFTIISLKLIYIQIYKHDDYEQKANNTATKFVSEKAPRGEILDQNGNVLATNEQTYALTYTKTDEADKAFYDTMDIIFSILNENGESVEDDLKLKIDENNNWYIDYDNTDADLIKSEDIRFKRDRGLNEQVEKKLKYNTENEDLTDEQIDKVNDKLYEITPEEVFYYLVKSYNIIDVIKPSEKEAKQYAKMSGKKLTQILLDKGYTYQKLRDYIVIKDALKMKSFQGYKSVTIKKNLNKDAADIILQKLNNLPGIDVTLEPTRKYPYGTLASSVIGYLSSISETNKEEYELRGYDASTDTVGVAGIESAFEEQLRGVTGGTTVKVNSSGRVTQELFKLEAYPGNNINLTIDKNLQYVATTALQNTMNDIVSAGEYKNANRGAVVVMEVNTGRILALVSLPEYDPNNFSVEGKISDEEKKAYFSPDLETFGTQFIQSRGLNKTIDDLFPKDENGNREDIYDIYPRPFYNYATQGLIPPGSTFKPLTAIAGLESGVVTPSETIYDTGVFDIHPELFTTETAPKYHVAYGNVDVARAIEVSCNFFFYEVAYRMYQQAPDKVEGLNALASFAWRFGLGVDPNGDQRASTGIEISENFGQVYNYTSYKNTMASLVKYNLNSYLESGSLRGYSFVPFDFSARDDDSEELKDAKVSLKDKIINRLKSVDPNNVSALGNSDEFAKKLISDIKKIMDNSELYKQNVSEYESSHNTKVDLDNEATKIANAIALYVVYDVTSEMTSAAQEVYAAIGQGTNTFTPLQLAQYVSTLANGGTRYKAHLVDKITNPEGEVIQEYGSEVLDKIDLDENNLKAVIEGMKRVTQDDSGTAFTTFSNFPITIAGKTGTADFKDEQYDLGRAPYATFISFAPADDPKIAVATVVYDGGHGGSAAPVAKAVYEYYFKDQILEANPGYQFYDYVLNTPADNK